MNIAIIGNDSAFMEAKAKLGDSHQYFHDAHATQEVLSHALDVIFDFTTEWQGQDLVLYNHVTTPVFFNTVFSTLASVRQKLTNQEPVFGFCGLPTFFNRSRLEVVAAESDKERLADILSKLEVDYTLVKDQVGMVTPRVVCMIINEAYEALQQGVASKTDIDLSMKLGTNYPYGPFEWGERIGLMNVRKLLLQLMVVGVAIPG